MVGCGSAGSDRMASIVPGRSADPVRVVIIRHAEKPSDESNPHLSKAGRQHAQQWATILTEPDGPLGGVKPAALLAPQPTRHHPSQRPGETLEPLAAKLGQPVLTPYPSEEFSSLAADVRKKYTHEAVVICWVHESLPDLARALGVRSPIPAWKGKDFDQVWIIEYPMGQATLRSEVATPSRAPTAP